jgi:F-type H+-transporting ATPase subunit epsilon
METLHARLISPEGVIFEGAVRSVLLSGVEGDMTVLPGHAPVMTLLFPGMIFAIDADGKGLRAFVRGGVAEITGAEINVLAERVLPVEEVTRERIDEEISHLRLVRDAAADETSRAEANVAISRLEEYKGSLRL